MYSNFLFFLNFLHFYIKQSPQLTNCALDLAATKIYFSANNMAANPSFLSEGNYVIMNETLQNNIKECALILTQLQSLSLPHTTHLSLKVLSSQFKNGRLSCRKHNCSACSFSAVYVNLRHNRLCLPEYLPKRVF